MSQLVSVFILIILTVSVACHHRPEKSKDKAKEKSIPEQIESTDTRDVSKWIRSNNKDYWMFARNYVNQTSSELARFTSVHGVLVGDAHLANFSAIPVEQANGAEVMRYVDIDFDDAGRGPFVLDLARLLITSKAAKPKLNDQESIDAYLLGLSGRVMLPPPKVQSLLDKSLENYFWQYDRFVAEKTNKNSFKYKAGKLEAYNGIGLKNGVTIEMLNGFFPGKRVIDLALRPISSGGSAGFLRLWIYVKNAQDRSLIYELKQLEPTSLAEYQEQEPIDIWISSLRNIFLPGLKSETLKLVEIPGRGMFWLREKKVTLVDVPYTSQISEDLMYVQQFTNYDAFYLGQLHARQPNVKSLLKMLETDADKEALSRAIKMFEKAYLERAVEIVRSGSSITNLD